MDVWKFHDVTFTWLDGGLCYLDGGAMFGVVPKALWSRKYPEVENNTIPLRTDPILVEIDGKYALIDAGVGYDKWPDKMKRNLGIQSESRVEQSLGELGLTPEQIDMIWMTHMHHDHASGLTKRDGDGWTSIYPNADIYVSQTEWDELRNPNIRSRNAYWRENWEPLVSQVKTFDETCTVAPGVTMEHTGGHSDGHAVIRIEREGETVLHMADIMPTHAHQNPLWVLAYDDYPMTSIYAKQRYMEEALSNQYRFIFYHDAIYRMVQFSEDGRSITESLESTAPR